MSEKLASTLSLCEPTDTQLIKATLDGNKDSFGKLIQTHQPAIFLMAHRHLRQREEAEDLAQQVFLLAFRNLGKFRGESKFSTWLYTIALNLVRNHVRQRNTRRTTSLDVIVNAESGLTPQYPDKAPSPEDIAHHRWELARVGNAVESLTDLHRTIFTLHYFQHLPLKDVAVRVDRPLGTVKVYLHRARKSVLKKIEEENKSQRVTAPNKLASKGV